MKGGKKVVDPMFLFTKVLWTKTTENECFLRFRLGQKIQKILILVIRGLGEVLS